MKNLTFKKLAIKVLEEENRPLSVEEIWDIAVKKGYDKLIKTTGKTPWRTIGAQIYVDIRDNEKTPFIKIESKPRKFFLKDKMSNEELEKYIEKEQQKEEKKKTNFLERDLHPFLTYFAYSHMNVYTKTIYHEKSNKKSYSQWLHPDMVGVYFPIKEWKNEVIDFAKEIGFIYLTLYSFEIKKELGFHNLRESFFQTVSNSSWANEGYLVTANLNKDNDFLSELKRLSSSFGIGIIELDITNPDNSNIIFPAKRKNELDWDTINKLSTENPDFRDFLIKIKNDLRIKEIRKEEYDKVLKIETLLNKFPT